MTYWVYILASRRHGALYVGVTSDLERRITQHREKRFSGFTATYNIARLVYAQGFGEVAQAIAFEKRLKRWRRDWKVRLIEEDNPHWEDLFLRMIAMAPLHPDIAAAMAENAQPKTTSVIPVSTQSKTGTSSADACKLPRAVEPWRNQAPEVPVFARSARAKPG